MGVTFAMNLGTNTESDKIDRYINMITDMKKLKNASKSMIRKKLSSIARQIERGNEKIIKKVAFDVFHGSQLPEQKDKICEAIEKAAKLFREGVSGKTWREIVGGLIGYIIGTFNIAGGLLFSILWIIREKLFEYYCPNHCI